MIATFVYSFSSSLQTLELASSRENQPTLMFNYYSILQMGLSKVLGWLAKRDGRLPKYRVNFYTTNMYRQTVKRANDITIINEITKGMMSRAA